MNRFSVFQLGEEHNQLIEQALKKATGDAAFRTKLINQPVRTLSELTGLQIPDSIRIRFIENAGADMTIVLPDLQTADSGELSDAALDAVAGGDDSWIEVEWGCMSDQRPPDDWGTPNNG